MSVGAKVISRRNSAPMGPRVEQVSCDFLVGSIHVVAHKTGAKMEIASVIVSAMSSLVHTEAKEFHGSHKLEVEIRRQRP
jgi:hypothetical protein